MSLRDDIEVCLEATEGRSGFTSLTDLEHFAACLAGQIQGEHPDLAERISNLSKKDRES